jgi:hypothetical protein
MNTSEQETKAQAVGLAAWQTAWTAFIRAKHEGLGTDGALSAVRKALSQKR